MFVDSNRDILLVSDICSFSVMGEASEAATMKPKTFRKKFLTSSTIQACIKVAYAELLT
ncbi:hypothetical protein MA16_Dca020923 [Dendrobium catenatum]|uniref:Uncharacterized protein n=1 Tax=Dendrobium catenatum TaxID=906689 RepID=A0A2I0VN56_9ASPA|nr:hypothetical protein MA16_Dca020923 [Dendrobium catenatum]